MEPVGKRSKEQQRLEPQVYSLTTLSGECCCEVLCRGSLLVQSPRNVLAKEYTGPRSGAGRIRRRLEASAMLFGAYTTATMPAVPHPNMAAKNTAPPVRIMTRFFSRVDRPARSAVFSASARPGANQTTASNPPTPAISPIPVKTARRITTTERATEGSVWIARTARSVHLEAFASATSTNTIAQPRSVAASSMLTGSCFAHPRQLGARLR